MHKGKLFEKARRIRSWVLKNNLLYIISLVYAFVLLHIPIENLLEKIVIIPILSGIERTLYNDIAFVLISLFLLISPLFKVTSPSRSFFVLVISLATIYSFYRVLSFDRWELTSLNVTQSIKYLDVVYIVLVGQIIQWIRAKTRKEEEKKSSNSYSFNDDHHITKVEDDILGFSRYVKLLSQAIKDEAPNEQALAVGITGKWGSGKTSFMSLLNNELDEERFIKVNIHPWNSSDSKVIIYDSLESLQEAIQPYKSVVSKALVSYSKRLVDINDSSLNKSMLNAFSIFFEFNTVSSLKKRINKGLRELDKKVVVFIDDLDRLDKKEIIEVIRLIRNTANFSNVTYIVSYDKGYVSNALKDVNDYGYENFLDKIFQLEISIPIYNRKLLEDVFTNRIKKLFPDSDSEIESSPAAFLKLENPFLQEWLTNMRDVKRLLNNIKFYYPSIEGEVVFKDFVKLEIIHLNHPYIYELIFQEKGEFLESKDITKPAAQYSLNEKKFKEYLAANFKILDIKEEDIDKITTFVKGLFISELYFRSEEKGYMSINYPNKFERYFMHILSGRELSEKDYQEAIEQDIDGFKSRIKDWVEEGKALSVARRLYLIKDFSNRENFEKIISGIFYLANLDGKTEGNRFHRTGRVWYDIDNLIGKITNYDGEIGKKHYSDINEYSSFIISFFDNASNPYLFESYLANRLFYKDIKGNYFPVSKSALEDYILNYLKKYCCESDKIDANTWGLYWNCILTDWIPSGSNSWTPQKRKLDEADTVLRDFILEKDLNGFLVAIIEGTFKENKFAVNKIANELFNGWEGFEDMLNGQDESKWSYLKEFKEFFILFKAESFTRYVEFEFKEIKLT